MRVGAILFCAIIAAWSAMIGSAAAERGQQLAAVPAPVVAGVGPAATPKAEIRNPKSADPKASEAADFFETHVRPVLVENCFSCHGAQMQMAGLRLDSRAAALKGSDRGPVLVPGEPEKSALIR